VHVSKSDGRRFDKFLIEQLALPIQAELTKDFRTETIPILLDIKVGLIGFVASVVAVVVVVVVVVVVFAVTIILSFSLSSIISHHLPL